MMLSQYRKAKGVEGAYGQILQRKEPLNPRAHLHRSLIGKGKRQDILRLDIFHRDQMDDPLRQDARLARARACYNHAWALSVLDAGPLSAGDAFRGIMQGSIRGFGRRYSRIPEQPAEFSDVEF